MKRGKRLTRELKIATSAYGLNPKEWTFLKSISETYAVIASKEDATKTKVIDRNAKPKKERDTV